MSGVDGEPEPESHDDLFEAWYEPIGDPLEQGDLLFDFPLPVITFDPAMDELGLAWSTQHVIVVTQSCDVPKKAQTEFLLASVFDYAVLREADDNFRSSEFRKSLSRGTNVAEFALPPKPQGNGEFLVVSFRKLHVVPKSYVQDRAADALRLRSPYKEYFAQAYARFMMRVGLPLPLPEIK